MEGLERAHTGIDGVRFVVDIGVPTFGDVRRRGVECIVTFVVEGDSLEGIFGFLNIGAGSDSIILEEL